METNNNLESVFELLEQYEFAKLTEVDKKIVLSVMTESEYSEMRKTIKDLKFELKEDIDPSINTSSSLVQKNQNKIRYLLNYQLKLYQVAASIAIIITSFFIFQYSNKNNTKHRIANNDTIIIHKIDTVYSIIYDTLDVIKEKVFTTHSHTLNSKKHNLITQINKKNDCINNLCPNEIENINLMNSRNTISNDTITKGILLSLN